MAKATPRRCLWRHKKDAKVEPFSLCHLPFDLTCISKTIGVVKMLLACKDVDAIQGSEEGITPSRVACGFGHEYIFDLLSGYEDRTPDMTTQDTDSFDGNLKLNLDRSAVIVPLEYPR